MHLKDNRQEYLDLIEQYFTGQYGLSAASIRQLRKSIEEPKDKFWHEFVLPQLVTDQYGRAWDKSNESDLDPRNLSATLSERPAYLFLSSAKQAGKRFQNVAVDAYVHYQPGYRFWTDARDVNSLYANFMRFGRLEDGDQANPSQRVTLGPLTVFTFEFDPPKDLTKAEQIEQLDHQFSWFRRAGNSKNSYPFFAMIEWLREWSDYRGCVANYSGNQSLHISLIFDSSRALPDGSPLKDTVRPFLIECHNIIGQKLTEIMNLGIGYDAQLRFPEQMRRLPNGIRYVEPSKPHLFGVPAHAAVPQVTIFEDLLKQAPNGAARRLIDPFVIEHSAAKFKGNRKAAKRIAALDDRWINEEERLFCEQRLREKIEEQVGPDGYPKLARLTYETKLIAHLYANEGDENPQVVIFENGIQSCCQGGKEPTQHVVVFPSLAKLVAKWQREWRKLHPPENESVREVDDLTERVILVQPTNETQSVEAARATMSDAIGTNVPKSKIMLIKGPEGIGKTTAVLRRLPWMVQEQVGKDLLALDGRSPKQVGDIYRRPSMVAFSSYEIAQTKCDEFNSDPNINGCVGIVFESLSREYSISCDELDEETQTKIERFSPSVAGQAGHSSLIDAIKTKQPEVWSRIKLRHHVMTDALRNLEKDVHVVYFTVHDVLHQWSEGGLSPAFAHPDFFETEPNEYWKLSEQMRLRVAIHDELSFGQFVHLKPEHDVVACHELFQRDARVWGQEFPKLSEKFHSWKTLVQGSGIDLDFNEVTAIHRIGFTPDNTRTVMTIEPYGESERHKPWQMYAERIGSSLAFQRRRWWCGLANQTILLTTEELPTQLYMAEMDANPDMQLLDCGDLLVGGGHIDLHLLLSLSAKNNSEVISQMREFLDLPDLTVISDSAKSVKNVVSFDSARGSNDYEGQNLMQLANFVSPELYGYLQVINAIYGTNNAIRVRHVDLINQAAGRNLGYRSQGNPAKHHLVISDTLWETIHAEMVLLARYTVYSVEDSNRRRDGYWNHERASINRAREEDELYEMDVLLAELKRARRQQVIDDARYDELVRAAGYYDEVAYGAVA